MNPFELVQSLYLMKIEIPVSDEIKSRLDQLSQMMGTGIEEASCHALKSGLQFLLNQVCATCGSNLTESFAKCDYCSLSFDCGYVMMQFANERNGEKWLSKPETTCYSCLIFTELESDLESFIKGTREENIWQLKEQMPDIIEDIINESIRTTGDGETVTMVFPIKTEKVNPKSWKILQLKMDRFLIEIQHRILDT